MRNIPMFRVAMNPEIDVDLLKVINSGWIGQGQKVKEFEEKLSKVFHNENVLTLSAGTHGLTLALRLAGVGIGDEVITSPLTCTATNMPILQQGAKIVWADVKNDFNIDPKSIKECITEKTKAIMFVHWGGYPCDLEEIRKIADKYNLVVIEDAAHAYLSTYRGTYIGDCTYSDYMMCSFQAIKHLTCVDGGALCCKSEESYRRGKLLRWYGIDREGPRSDFRCEENIKEWGYKFHMNDVCATIGMTNMRLAEENVYKARENAQYYEKELSKIDGIEFTQISKNRQSSYWLFTILVENRSDFTYMMGSRGISISRVHERNDKHDCFKESKRELPGLDSIINKMICIPVGWWVSNENREYIVNCIKEGW